MKKKNTTTFTTTFEEVMEFLKHFNNLHYEIIKVDINFSKTLNGYFIDIVYIW